jgi:purine-nucleoside phosphorylase
MNTIDTVAAAGYLRSELPFRPRVAVVLGSGLGSLVDDLEDTTAVAFREIPGFPAASVAGHAGKFLAGRLDGTEVLVQSGRYHLYEGHSPDIVAAPVRAMAELGVRTLVLTNAAGGVRASLQPGDVVLLEDHINLTSQSPLVGPVRTGEERFPDMSAPYAPELRQLAVEAAAELGIGLESGVYAGVLGPSYETAAEVRMLAKLGADVVGMSTVTEVIAARARGLRCLAFSVVTNKATGLGGSALSHADVLAAGQKAGTRLAALIRSMVPRLG